MLKGESLVPFLFFYSFFLSAIVAHCHLLRSNKSLHSNTTYFGFSLEPRIGIIPEGKMNACRHFLQKNNNFCPLPQSLQHVQLFVSEGFDLSLNNTYLLPSSPYPPPSPFCSGPIGGVEAADGYLNAKRCCNSARRGGVNERREIEGRKSDSGGGRAGR